MILVFVYLHNVKQNAVKDGRFRPRCRHLANSNKLASSLILPIQSVMWKRDIIHKTEAHNVIQCRQRRTESRPQVTFTENSVKFGRVVFEICERTERTNRQTYIHADHNTSHSSRGRSSSYTWLAVFNVWNETRVQRAQTSTVVEMVDVCRSPGAVTARRIASLAKTKSDAVSFLTYLSSLPTTIGSRQGLNSVGAQMCLSWAFTPHLHTRPATAPLGLHPCPDHDSYNTYVDMFRCF